MTKVLEKRNDWKKEMTVLNDIQQVPKKDIHGYFKSHISYCIMS